MSLIRMLWGALSQLKFLLTFFFLIARFGWPRIILRFNGGVGDHLLCTAIARELRKRGGKKIWMMTRYNDLFEGNHDFTRLLPNDQRYLTLARYLKIPDLQPTYGTDVPGEDRQTRPGGHIIAKMCESAGIQGEIELRPYIFLTQDELRNGLLIERQVAIISSGLSAGAPFMTKQWYPERFQAVVDQLKDELNFIQLGSLSDPLLDGTLDLRGKTTLRQAAAILANCLLFIGNVGFLMHLARAVECRSVIVFGGREHPTESGYGCNENLYSALICSPCWIYNACPYDRECMKRISADEVVHAVRRQAAVIGTPPSLN